MTKVGHITTGFLGALLFGFEPFSAALGSIAPDKDIHIAKMSGTWKTNKKRTLFNSHRGITHHFLLIPLLLTIAINLKNYDNLYFLLASFSFGYALHLIMDSLTPFGIPYKASFYPRFAIPLFKTGSFKEFMLLIAFVSFFVFIAYQSDYKTIHNHIAEIFNHINFDKIKI